MNDQTMAADQSVTISARAAARVSELLQQESEPDLKLRVSVSGGGCSGFQYGFEFDAEAAVDDYRIERDGVTVLIDPMSLEFLSGSEIDFVEDLMGAAFRIHNPNASASCGCGSSFAV